MTEERQREIVEGIRRVAADSAEVRPYRYGFDKLAAVIPGPGQLYGSWEAVPGRLAQEAETLRARAREACPRVPEEYNVAAIELLGYRRGSSLTPHVDCVAGWSIIITLGATACFYFSVGERAGEPQHSVLLRSGDAILFPTSHEDGVWHGIKGFEPDSEPEWFKMEPYCRLCLQYRSSYYHLH